MKIVLSLMMLFCQNHIDYKGCVDDKMTCVDNYVSQKMEEDQPRQSSKILIGKIEEAYAESYLFCVGADIGTDGCADK
ncbi:hypothetical protein N9948_01995 [bacterium]|nr:hypothetical protein [bacterium]